MMGGNADSTCIFRIEVLQKVKKKMKKNGTMINEINGRIQFELEAEIGS